MTRGRRSQPAAIKDQKSAVRSTRKSADTDSARAPATYEAGAIVPPEWLKNEGLTIWRQMEPSLRQARLLTATDSSTFARYCRNFARWLSMQREIDKDGATYESESAHGKLRRVSPAVMIADRLERQLLATEDRFGINPAARQSIMAARARDAASTDLFAPQQKMQAASPTPATPPAEPLDTPDTDAPIGFLN